MLFRSIETLELQDDDIIFPDNSQLFVAMGAALNAKDVEESLSLEKLIRALKTLKDNGTEAAHTLEPLFHNEDELRGFRDRHLQAMTKKRNLKKYQGNIYDSFFQSHIPFLLLHYFFILLYQNF